MTTTREAAIDAVQELDSVPMNLSHEDWNRISSAILAALSTPTTEPHGYVDGSATGVRDRDGRMICVGDRLRMDMKGDNTKQDYWYPEYEVYFKAPTFRLKHIGGDKDSDTAHWYFSTPQESSRMKTETIAVAASPAPQPAADTRVVVKPLVWEAYAQGEISRPNDVHPEYCTAPSVSKERAGEWRLRGPWIGFNYYPTKEAAKSAAQADYESCILSAIIGTAQSDKITADTRVVAVELLDRAMKTTMSGIVRDEIRAIIDTATPAPSDKIAEAARFNPQSVKLRDVINGEQKT